MDGVGALQLSEISMKQKPIPSQTTAILFQHPTPTEQRASPFTTLKAHVKDTLILFIISLISTLLFYSMGNFLATVLGD